MNPQTLELDLQKTIKSRKSLFSNKNLLYWYQKLYQRYEGIFRVEGKYLEIGSGASPLNHFYKNIKTSDYLKLDYLDYSFDCHKINEVDEIGDDSLDVVIMTNVLHHLYDPIQFLNSVGVKLKKGGKIILIEPFPSFFSYPLYKFFHHEPFDLNSKEPKLVNQEGPLSSSNQAIPYLLFFKNNGWDQNLKLLYSWNEDSIKYYTFLSYFITGGISSNFRIPDFIYRFLFFIDLKITNTFPKVFASFFEITLEKRETI